MNAPMPPEPREPEPTSGAPVHPEVPDQPIYVPAERGPGGVPDPSGEWAPLDAAGYPTGLRYPGTQPGAPSGSQPGALSGSQPGAPSGSQPGAPIGSQPGALSGSQPGALPGSQPGAPERARRSGRRKRAGGADEAARPQPADQALRPEWAQPPETPEPAERTGRSRRGRHERRGPAAQRAPQPTPPSYGPPPDPSSLAGPPGPVTEAGPSGPPARPAPPAPSAVAARQAPSAPAAPPAAGGSPIPPRAPVGFAPPQPPSTDPDRGFAPSPPASPDRGFAPSPPGGPDRSLVGPVAKPADGGLARTFARRLLPDLGPNLAWEVLLFVATVVVVVSATASWPAMMDHGRLWAQLATIGLAASGFSLSLRTATPNVAVSAIAALSGFWFARLVAGHHLGAFPAALAMLATAAAIGAVCAVLVALVRLPAWAVTLVGMLLLQGVVYLGADRTSVPIHLVGEQDSLFFLFAGVFITGSIGGGVLFAFPVVRAALNRNRPAPPDGEPQPALGGPATTGWTGRLLGAAVGLVGSSVLAGLSGILLAMYVSAGNAASGTNVVYALAPVLIGGVSVVSARGGVFGVVLGMVLVTYAQFWLQLEGASSTVVYLVIALVALVGLLLGGGLEVAGRAVRRLTARGGR